MHPLKSAIELLHREVTRLHEATQDFEFTENEKDKVVEALLGYIPAAMEAAQGVMAAAFTYLSTRG